MRNFAFTKPTKLDQAVALLDEHPQWEVLAGGTSMVDLLKLNVVAPEGLVDITGVEQLQGHKIGGDKISFGALARMAAVADDKDLQAAAPVLTQSLWKAASPQLRNAARLGGNILQRTRCPYFRDTSYACNKRKPNSGCAALDGGQTTLHAVLGGSDQCVAMYPGDWAQALIAFDAEVNLISANGPRRIAFADLHVQPGTTPDIETTMRPGEIVVSIDVPNVPALKDSHYLKARERESYAFATASAAVGLEFDGDTIIDARIGLGGVATVPWRAREAETLLKGRRFNEALARSAGKKAFEGATALGGSAYKIELGASVVAGALVAAHQQMTEKG